MSRFFEVWIHFVNKINKNTIESGWFLTCHQVVIILFSNFSALICCQYHGFQFTVGYPDSVLFGDLSEFLLGEKPLSFIIIKVEKSSHFQSGIRVSDVWSNQVQKLFEVDFTVHGLRTKGVEDDLEGVMEFVFRSLLSKGFQCLSDLWGSDEVGLLVGKLVKVGFGLFYFLQRQAGFEVDWKVGFGGFLFHFIILELLILWELKMVLLILG